MITNIEEIKSTADIVDVIGSYVKLKRAGSSYSTCCPFHTDKSPSFYVSRTRKQYKCFGCGASGDVFNFVMQHQRKRFFEAVKIVAERVGVDVVESESKHVKPLHRLEKLTPEFIQYFEERGISNNTLLRLGLTSSNEWMKKPNATIPVICFNYIREGELVNIKFRGANKALQLHKQSELILYNVDAISGIDTAVICEGETDCLSLYEAGIYNVVSVPNGGAKGGTLEYIYNCWEYLQDKKKIIIATDNDATGEALRSELAHVLGEYRCYHAYYNEDCKDANDVLVRHGKEQLKSLIESAKIADGYEWNDERKQPFPLHVFPDIYRNSMIEVSTARSLAPEFVATAALWTVSSLAGTHYYSEFNGEGKNILFCLLIAPMSVGKTPAFKATCATPLSHILEQADKEYMDKLKHYEEEKAAAYADNKKAFTKKKPVRYHPYATEGTTEGYIQLSIDQPNGIGVYHDEAESIISAGSYKKENDSISFFTQAFSGGRIMQIRADRDKERVVPNLNMNLLMGTQTSRLSNIFTSDRLASGFASRFLMVESDYIELNTDVDPFGSNKEMCFEWRQLLEGLYLSAEAFNNGELERQLIAITDDAKELYRTYYRKGLEDANKRILSRSEQYIIGTEAKMSAYFPRFCQILAIIHDSHYPKITADIVEKAYQLYRYYAESTVKIISKITVQVETGLPPELELLYKSLPDNFNRKDAVSKCVQLGLTENKFESAMRRKDFKALFAKTGNGTYSKL